ncbi:MAG: lysophospholipid acyltransferase family protein [Methylobacterium sp.]|uniref:lysophospholipid acyltransferase family protein n=1 Tax=Methylobacterium sp. TaxID=409 RepID=UPI0025CDCD31|nr:lysophospholipid acyltransferase family protein [Methylobacterium sp.]MBX9931502.1 lysophospholipid acyltransferase family protein [Methylobacterium sp.]
MSLIKRIGRAAPVQNALGMLAERYLRLVRRTNHFVVEPTEPNAWLDGLSPFIAGMWHGQHTMISFMRRPHDRIATIISRSADGNVNTITLTRMGVSVIRASGARGRAVRDIRAKGGAEGLRAMLRALKDGQTVAFSADVPKVSRRCDEGILTLARFSGRPIVPVAVVTSRHLRFNSWDRACFGLPFGRGAMVFGEPIMVPREIEPDAFEVIRLRVQDEMNRVHDRAYSLVGRPDRIGNPP